MDGWKERERRGERKMVSSTRRPRFRREWLQEDGEGEMDGWDERQDMEDRGAELWGRWMDGCLSQLLVNRTNTQWKPAPYFPRLCPIYFGIKGEAWYRLRQKLTRLWQLNSCLWEKVKRSQTGDPPGSKQGPPEFRVVLVQLISKAGVLDTTTTCHCLFSLLPLSPRWFDPLNLIYRQWEMGWMERTLKPRNRTHLYPHTSQLTDNLGTQQRASLFTIRCQTVDC